MFELEVGLHDGWRRHYDPSLGRYTQPDPLSFVDGPSVYAYVGNDPQAGVDFEGLNRIRRSGGGGGSFLTPPGVNPDALSYPPRPPRGGPGPGNAGRAGEQLVRQQCEIGRPETFSVNGRGRRSDGGNERSISEIKNCGSLCLTQQLRDYLAHANRTDRTLDLYTTRPTTTLSKPLQSLINSGQIRHNPNFKP